MVPPQAVPRSVSVGGTERGARLRAAQGTNLSCVERDLTERGSAGESQSRRDQGRTLQTGVAGRAHSKAGNLRPET
jgi:hypothetical protein